jgi:phosphoenolpyruvate synthase/pyruvate phosphate dikinase
LRVAAHTVSVVERTTVDRAQGRRSLSDSFVRPLAKLAKDDERDGAVTEYIRRLITRARELGLQTSICGQAPSVYPEYTDLLVGAGIDAISVSVDAVDRARRLIAAAEQRALLEAARARAGPSA